MPIWLLNEKEIHYQVFGQGMPILLIHGFSPDSRLMMGCLESLFKNKEGYKRIYLDFPGMGRTKGYQTFMIRMVCWRWFSVIPLYQECRQS